MITNNNAIKKLRKAVNIKINITAIADIDITALSTYKLIVYIVARYSVVKDTIKLEPMSIEREYYMPNNSTRLAIRDLVDKNIIIPVIDNKHYYSINKKYFTIE